MRYLSGWLAGILVLGAASTASAQDDAETFKKKLLEAVEKRLKLEEQRILEEISKLIDEEFAKLRGGKPADPPKPGPKPAEPPRPADPPKPARKKAGYLGIRPGELTEEERAAAGVEGGVKIASVVEDGPAAKGGLQEDDILLAIDGEKVADAARIPRIVVEKGAGTAVTLSILRGKEKKELKIVLGVRPDDPEAVPPEHPKLPAEPPKPETPKSEEELRDRMKKFLGKPGSLGIRVTETPGGVVVEEAVPGGAADKGGLKKGDVLKSIGGTAIKAEKDLEGYMGASAKAGATVDVVVVRDGKELKLPVTFGERK